MMLLKKIQRGFAALIAVIVLVLFALLGVYLATQMTTASINTSASYLEMQAWLDARSAVEWGAYQALYGSGCAASSTFSIGDFNVTVNCAATPVTEGPNNYTVYNLKAVASRGTPGDVAYVTRRVMTYVTNG